VCVVCECVGVISTFHRGRLAQLGERRVRNAEARSSILLPSTNLRSDAVRAIAITSEAQNSLAEPERKEMDLVSSMTITVQLGSNRVETLVIEVFEAVC
jgi:hypothetical protein